MIFIQTKVILSSEEQQLQFDKLAGLMQVIETIMVKLNGVHEQDKIFQIVVNTFKDYADHRFNISIINPQGKLVFLKMAVAPNVFSKLLKKSGFNTDAFDFLISNSYRQAILTGKTIITSAVNISKELFPAPLAAIVNKSLKVGAKDQSVIVPIKKYDKVIGVFDATVPGLTENFMPILEILSSFITANLERGLELANSAEQTAELSIISKTESALVRGASLEEIIKIICLEIKIIFKCNYLSCFTKEQRKDGTEYLLPRYINFHKGVLDWAKNITKLDLAKHQTLFHPGSYYTQLYEDKIPLELTEKKQLIKMIKDILPPDDSRAKFAPMAYEMLDSHDYFYLVPFIINGKAIAHLSISRNKVFSAAEKIRLSRLVNTLAMVVQYKKAEQREIQQKELLKNFLDNAPVISFVINAEGFFEISKGATLSVLGLKNNQAVEANLNAYDIYKDNPVIIDCIKDAFNGKSMKSELFQQGAWFDVTFAPFEYGPSGKVRKIQGQAIEITERKYAEDALKEVNWFLSESQAVAGLGSYALDILNDQWDSSKVLDRVFGIEEDFPRSTAGWISLIHPADQQMMTDYFAREVLGNHNTFDKEYRIIRKLDGVMRWVHGLGKLEFNGQGQPIRMIGTIQDITERKEAMEQLLITQEAVLNSMAILAESRDNQTGMHIHRTKMYVEKLLEKIGDAIPWAKEKRNLIALSALLHDIGKVGISDSILLKPDKLTPGEFEEMKKHTIYGYKAIMRTKEQMGNVNFLEYALSMTRSHHEKWDGTGYPDGKKGREIPLSARLMALADVYDALVTDRPYKQALTHEEAVKIIQEESDTHFDPMLVELFVKNHLEFKAIAEKYKG